MTLPAKWADKKERPKFADRVGLAQPVLAAGALTFFSLLFGLPILYLLNGAFDTAVAPATLMADFRLGSAYNDVTESLDGPLGQLILAGGNLSFAGVLACAFAFALLAWAVAMVLVSQWRTQLPVLETVEPLRFFTAFVVTLILLSTLFWLARQAGSGIQDSGALALSILHFAFGFLILLSWYYAITGTFISWRSILMTAFTVSGVITFFVWVLGFSIPANPLDYSANVIIVIGHLFGLWLLIVLGVHSLARETLNQSDWQDLDTLSRGQQVDFGLAIMKTLGDNDNKNRWISGHSIAERLGAKHAITVQALQRLNENGLVRASRATNRPDHWRLSTESLHGLNLQDLMEAFGATLDPNDGVYEEGPQQALIDLADQERRIFRTDLASLTRSDRGPALTSDAPAFLSLISDRGLGTQTDAAGAPPPVSSPPKAYERLTALFERESAAQETSSSQLTAEFPAFNLPPKPNTMDRTRAAAEESPEDENETHESTDEAQDNDTASKAPASPISQRLSQLDDSQTESKTPPKAKPKKTEKKKKPAKKKPTGKAPKSTQDSQDTPRNPEKITQDSKEVSSKPVVSTGLTSLVKDKEPKEA